MTRDEYRKLFFDLELNLVAFKMLMECDEEVLKLVNAAIKAEREECAKLCDEMPLRSFPSRASDCAAAIRARGEMTKPCETGAQCLGGKCPECGCEWQELDVNEAIELIHENIPNPTPELLDKLYGLVAAIDLRLQEKNT